MTLDELNAESDRLDAERAALTARKRDLNSQRKQLAEAEHAAYYGLTPDEYNGVKEQARLNAEGDLAEYSASFIKLLGMARRKRSVQVAQAAVAQIQGQASNPG